MLLEPLPDVIPLTSVEKARLAELETVVEKHLESFLLVGRALCEIRGRRLYRVEFPTFEAYLKERWGLTVWKANEVIASFSCAELLLSTTGAPNGPTPLPEHVPEGPMREIAKVDGDDLKSQTWRLVATVSRQSGASLRSAARQISHMVMDAVGEADLPNGQHRGAVKTAPKAVFVRSIIQLSRENFDVQLATLQLNREQEARTVYRACQLISTRCAAVQAHLSIRYPQLCSCPPVQPNGSSAFANVAVRD